MSGHPAAEIYSSAQEVYDFSQRLEDDISKLSIWPTHYDISKDPYSNMPSLEYAWLLCHRLPNTVKHDCPPTDKHAAARRRLWRLQTTSAALSTTFAPTAASSTSSRAGFKLSIFSILSVRPVFPAMLSRRKPPVPSRLLQVSRPRW